MIDKTQQSPLKRIPVIVKDGYFQELVPSHFYLYVQKSQNASGAASAPKKVRSYAENCQPRFQTKVRTY